MTELLFGLTVVFVGYVLYEVFRTISETNISETDKAPPPEANPPLPAAKKPAAETRDAPLAAAAEAGPKPAPPAPKPPGPAGDRERGAQIKNPATGEVSAVPTNYRFAKKWIKEALVSEGLLDRIYKPNELDASSSQKVKEALETLRLLDKYQP